MVSISQIIIFASALFASASAVPFNKIARARGYAASHSYGGGYNNDGYFPPCEYSYSYEYGSDGYRYGYENGRSCLILEDYCKVYHDNSKCYGYDQPPPPSKNGYLYSGMKSSGNSYTPPATIVLKLENKGYNYNSWDANTIQVQTGGSAGCFGVDAGGNYRIKDIVSISEGFGVFFYTAEGCVRDTRLDDGKPPVTEAGPASQVVKDSPVKSLRLVAV
ncbi:hypothetical protein HK098_004197 [Nowakowskiella sp. JEL0407]|nr:hypothetical protein HK098_004197 [Nowakowskiella sp. JEL0407]